MNSIKVFFIIVFGLFGQNVYAQSDAPLTSIPSLDVQKYLGRWYEISKFPNSFQKKCVAKTSAEYELNTDGSLRVLNQCQLADGEMNQAIGQAKQIGDSHSAKLEVRFAPIWLSFLPSSGVTTGLSIWMKIINWLQSASPRKNTCGSCRVHLL